MPHDQEVQLLVGWMDRGQMLAFLLKDNYLGRPWFYLMTSETGVEKTKAYMRQA